ncbi:FCGBP protein, partial [Grallaria varia]|nr:FCGBP protein [Grallaria varia]
ITTAFGVTVTFDWHSNARVILPGTLAGNVCGLCGNANGDPHDDFVTRQGQPAHNDTHFGDSWKVAEVPGCSPGCGEGCGGCGEAERRAYRGDKHCGILVKKRGPLATCHEVIDPTPYLEDCLFDTCLFEGHRDAVCHAVGAYVSACQSRGVALGPWRTHAFCSPVCPPNEHYELCGPPCPPSCQDESGPAACVEPSGCSEGCFCDAGFLRSGESCVPLSQCGCTQRGRYYPRGAQFYPSPPCTQRCVCAGPGRVECEPSPGCPPGQECGLRDGLLGCHPRSPCGHCQLLAGGTYSTFGGQLGSFGGSCSLPLLELDGGDPQEDPEPLRVALEQHEGEVRRVTVTARGVTVAMARGQHWEVTVDGERHALPLWLAGGTLGVTQVGTHRLLLLRGGPKLLYDGESYAVLTRPPPGRSPRGLCEDPDALGTPSPGCPHALGTPPAGPACPLARRCAVLADPAGPFAGCHRAVPPGPYLGTCERQVCQGGGRGAPAEPCPALRGYAAACQAAGAELREWRAGSECPLRCPPQSQYQLCARTDARTCAGVSALVPHSGRCFEGCQCLEGLLFDGARCVPPGSCGC